MRFPSAEGVPRKGAVFIPMIALAYFAVQLGVPLALRLAPTGSVATDFSWDMFSQRAECDTLSASAKLPNGKIKALRLERAFTSPQLRRLLYPGRLERFARFICDGLTATHGAGVGLFLDVQCRYSRDGELVALADGQRNWCVLP
jgi:hypothetical protein